MKALRILSQMDADTKTILASYAYGCYIKPALENKNQTETMEKLEKCLQEASDDENGNEHEGELFYIDKTFQFDDDDEHDHETQATDDNRFDLIGALDQFSSTEYFGKLKDDSFLTDDIAVGIVQSFCPIASFKVYPRQGRSSQSLAESLWGMMTRVNQGALRKESIVKYYNKTLLWEANKDAVLYHKLEKRLLENDRFALQFSFEQLFGNLRRWTCPWIYPLQQFWERWEKRRKKVIGKTYTTHSRMCYSVPRSLSCVKSTDNPRDIIYDSRDIIDTTEVVISPIISEDSRTPVPPQIRVYIDDDLQITRTPWELEPGSDIFYFDESDPIGCQCGEKHFYSLPICFHEYVAMHVQFKRLVRDDGYYLTSKMFQKNVPWSAYLSKDVLEAKLNIPEAHLRNLDLGSLVDDQLRLSAFQGKRHVRAMESRTSNRQCSWCKDTGHDIRNCPYPRDNSYGKILEDNDIELCDHPLENGYFEVKEVLSYIFDVEIDDYLVLVQWKHRRNTTVDANEHFSWIPFVYAESLESYDKVVQQVAKLRAERALIPNNSICFVRVQEMRQFFKVYNDGNNCKPDTANSLLLPIQMGKMFGHNADSFVTNGQHFSVIMDYGITPEYLSEIKDSLQKTVGWDALSEVERFLFSKPHLHRCTEDYKKVFKIICRNALSAFAMLDDEIMNVPYMLPGKTDSNGQSMKTKFEATTKLVTFKEEGTPQYEDFLKVFIVDKLACGGAILKTVANKLGVNFKDHNSSTREPDEVQANKIALQVVYVFVAKSFLGIPKPHERDYRCPYFDVLHSCLIPSLLSEIPECEYRLFLPILDPRTFRKLSFIACMFLLERDYLVKEANSKYRKTPKPDRDMLQTLHMCSQFLESKLDGTLKEIQEMHRAMCNPDKQPLRTHSYMKEAISSLETVKIVCKEAINTYNKVKKVNYFI